MSEVDKFISRIEDMALAASNKPVSVFSDFIDPAMQLLAGREIGRYKNLDCSFFGGHNFAERKIMSIFKNDTPALDEYPIAVLKSDESLKVRHQDVLGSILSLGLDRSKVGDINILENCVQVFVTKPIGMFLVTELNKIASKNVSFKMYEINEAIEVEPDFKDMNIIVPSMRLDAIVCNSFKLSRNEANMFVKGGKVKVNHMPITKPGHTVKEGDMLSVRTKGRVIVDSINGSTKKGNTKLLVKKFI